MDFKNIDFDFEDLQAANDKVSEAQGQIKELLEREIPDEETIRKEYEDKLQELQNRLKKAESDVTQRFAVHFEIFQREYDTLVKTIRLPESAEVAEKLTEALKRCLSIFAERI